MSISENADKEGAQRLSLKQLQAWQREAFGLFFHFGMSTYDGEEFSSGTADASLFDPSGLDVEQWVSVARDSGARYAVLTAKHTSGFCLWPSAHTNYTVENAANKTDIVGRFVKACRDQGVKPGLYYCLWDNHHRFGSVTPSDVLEWNKLKVTSATDWAKGIDFVGQ